MSKSKPKPISSLRFLGLLLLVALFGFFVAHVATDGKSTAIIPIPGVPNREDVAKNAANHASKIYEVDPDLILAVMWKESRYNARAKGKAGEFGLMQLMPGTANEWAEKTRQTNFKPSMLYDPKVNAEAGTWYIQRGLELWNHKADPLPYALARYNAGQSRAKRWEKGTRDANQFIEAIDIESTRQYVRDVIDQYGKNIGERVRGGK